MEVKGDGVTAVWKRSVVLCWLLAAATALAEVSYPPVVRGYRIEFPRDEGSHPRFRTEWWYITGWVENEAGDPIGFQITFFRSRPGVDEDNPSRFAARQLLFAHVAVSDPRRGRLLHDEKAAREGFGLAAAAQGGLDVHIDEWSLRRQGELYRASITARDLDLELEFQSTQPPMLQGETGFSRKGPDPRSASYYYSLPQLHTNGRLVVDGREHEVRGVSWFDHEWSSSIMDEAAQGWDWVGLNLEDGGALTAFQMRDEQGNEYWAAATRRESERRTADSGQSDARNHARVTVFPSDEVDWRPLRHWRSPRTGIEYPIEWQVTAGERTITLRPLMDDQENDARGSTGTIYWEGAVRAFDETNRLIGRGYLELTGYGQRVKF